MCRKRFNRNRVASSENYEQSREVHRQYIRECHERNGELCKAMILNITVERIKVPHVKVFGKLIVISMEEVERLKVSCNIVWL